MNPPDFDVVAKRADALAALVEARLPMEADVVGLHQAWPLVGPALLSHATSTLRSIVLLGPAGAHTDASRLLRSLYDHVVTFAWLAADSSAERLALWRLEDLAQRLKAVREMAEAGEPILDDAARDEMQREVDAATRTTTPDLAAKALAADRYWAPQVEALDETGLGTFRGLYTVLFRSHSGLVHATFRGLNTVVEDLSPTRRRVLARPPLDGRGAYGMATIVHGLGLLVAAKAVGWPSEADVHNVFDTYPVR
jgi:hypothetical protein